MADKELLFTEALEEARNMVKGHGPGVVWTVGFRMSAAVKALGVPHDFLDGIAKEVAGDMVNDPRRCMSLLLLF